MSTFSTVWLIAILAGLLVYVLKGPRAVGALTSYERVNAAVGLILLLCILILALFN